MMRSSSGRLGAAPVGTLLLVMLCPMGWHHSPSIYHLVFEVLCRAELDSMICWVLPGNRTKAAHRK